jgi:putative ABC transport system permease protein
MADNQNNQGEKHILDELRDVKGKAGIGSQIMLPWSKSFAMTKSNIFVRLGRSVITASGIFLGTAFLSSVLVSSAAQKAVAESLKHMTTAVGSGGDDSGMRTIWLVTMSLLVATIGIVNSMLMAVTERYKEIGTMKCLGAMDSFIVRLFLLESTVLGMLGGGFGVVVGGGAMAVITGMRSGWDKIPASAPVMLGLPLWLALLLTIPLGGILSVVASIYPAWRAAKMPPAAALRSEF